MRLLCDLVRDADLDGVKLLTQAILDETPGTLNLKKEDFFPLFFHYILPRYFPAADALYLAK